MSFRGSLKTVTCLAVFMAVSQVALAKDEQEAEVGVADKKAQEYIAKGIRLGGFDLFPKVTLSETYDDNIYQQRNNTSSDWITEIEPSLSLSSNWNRHALRFDARANVGRFADYGDNDYEDYNMRARTRIDALRSLTFKGDLSYNRGHEERGGDDVGLDAKNPIEMDTVRGQFDVKYQPNRLGVQFTADVVDYDYSDNLTLSGATTNNDDRDRTDMMGTLKVSYEVKKGYDAYIKTIVNQRDYDDATDDAGVNRDSDGYNAQAGLAIDLSKLLRADFAAGYMSQDYEDNSLDTASGWSGNASLNWFVTPLTTLRGSVSRAIEETTTAGASSIVGTRYAIGADHELLRNLLVSADIAYSESDYSGGTRNDDKMNYAAAIDYKFNRNFFAGAKVTFEDRDSNQSVNDYDRTKYMVKIGAQF
ncbi:outer membrane beta-barrel protein [Terasakiella pusilla]|uniref:outer membrane beta-barrel protein n=1 Tax=Terasakiella pusilla TaxID=64973 RepID=UPI003AA966FD